MINAEPPAYKKKEHQNIDPVDKNYDSEEGDDINDIL